MYGTNLNEEDWISLRDVILPFIHASDPRSVEIPPIPEHLESHPVVVLIRKYKKTGKDKYLDKAGQQLIQTEKPFGWYVILTK